MTARTAQTRLTVMRTMQPLAYDTRKTGACNNAVQNSAFLAHCFQDLRWGYARAQTDTLYKYYLIT